MKRLFFVATLVILSACHRYTYPKYHLAQQVRVGNCIGTVIRADARSDGKWSYVVGFELRCPSCTKETPSWIPQVSIAEFPEEMLWPVNQPINKPTLPTIPKDKPTEAWQP